jgi:hypothetical protein
MNLNIGFRKLIPGLLLILTVVFSIPAQTQHYEKSANGHDYGYDDIDRDAHESPFMRGFPAPWEMADNNGNKHQKYGRKHFDELTPEQKEMIKKRRKAFKSLPPEERKRIHKAREKFHNMPPEKREKLRKKWKNMSPEERDNAYKKKFKSHKNKKHKNKD